MYVCVDPCRLALTRTTKTLRQQDKNQKQQDIQIPSKPNILSKNELVDAFDTESDDEHAHIETTNQNFQASTSNLTANDQIKTIHQSCQPIHVNSIATSDQQTINFRKT